MGPGAVGPLRRSGSLFAASVCLLATASLCAFAGVHRISHAARLHEGAVLPPTALLSLL